MKQPLLRLAVSHVKNTLANQVYLQTSVDFTQPVHLHAQLNFKCNSRCSMCDSWEKGLQGYEELSAELWIKALDELKYISPDIKVSFAGGEILQKNDVFDIFRHCDEKNIIYGMITNGLLLNEKNIEKILNLHPYNIHISLDSLDTGGYEAIRGVRGLEVLKRNVINLMKRLHATNSKTVVTLKTVVCNVNLGELDEIVRFADKYKIHGVTFQPIVDITEEAKALFVQDFVKLQDMIDKLIRMKKEGFPILNSVDNIRSWVQYFDLSISLSPRVSQVKNNSRCVVSLKNVYILSSGEIKLCELYDDSLGNIKTDSISSVLISDSAKEKKKVLTHCERNCVYCIKRSLKDYLYMASQFISRN